MLLFSTGLLVLNANVAAWALHFVLQLAQDVASAPPEVSNDFPSC